MNVFWFKRDLRLEDNEALHLACDSDEPVLLIYILEPSLIDEPHTSDRHICFVKESLSDLNEQLKIFNTKILLVQAEVKDTFIKLLSHFPISIIYSTQEIGID
ncbi:deoxyribodipyrimidine photo-lyase, partial [Psychroserpens sp.]|uniref:deoxyribodipyrimidine photo-lyase n=1 Tax=Psychroserpens sp. TaxID=2020870 RepID=UPI003C74889A